MQRIAHSPKMALQIAVQRGCICEAVHPRGIKTRSAAEAKVPAGGLLVKQDDGTFLALDLVAVPCDDPDAAALRRHLQAIGKATL